MLCSWSDGSTFVQTNSNTVVVLLQHQHSVDLLMLMLVDKQILLQVEDLTDNRVVIVGTGGELPDSAD